MCYRTTGDGVDDIYVERDVVVHFAGCRRITVVLHHVQQNFVQLSIQLSTPRSIVTTFVNRHHSARFVLDLVGQVHLNGVNPSPVEVLEIATGNLNKEVSMGKARTIDTQLCALFVYIIDNQRHCKIQRVAVSESSRHIDVSACINQRSGVSLTIVTRSVLDHVIDVDVVGLTTNL